MELKQPIRQTRKHLWTLLLASLILSGCGGGSSSGSSESPPPLTVTPSSITAEAVQGTSATISLTLTVSSEVVTNGGYIALDDSGGMINDFDLQASSSTMATAILNTISTVAAGDYSGDLSFYVCKDSACATVYSTTPATVHYKITVNPAPPAATLMPGSINLTVQQGDPATAVLDAVLNSSVSVQGFALSDPQGRFSNTVNYIYKSANVDTITLNLLAVTDAPGTYSGSVSLLLCNGYTCTNQSNVPGSPVTIPYTITVTPFVPLAAIPTVTGLPEWETFQGNAGHTGYVPVTLNATTFASRWTWTFPTNDGYLHYLSPVTTGSGNAVLAVSGYVSPASLLALSESDGSVTWRHDFGSIFAASDPAVFGGRSFLITIDSNQNANIEAFSMSDGSPIFKTALPTQWNHYYAPTVKDGYVYTAGGTSGGVYAFNATTGVKRWSASTNQYDMWTPAVDGNYVYTYTRAQYSGENDKFSVLNVTDGSSAFTVGKSDFNWSGLSMNMAPVLPGDGSVLVIDGINALHPNHLVRYGVSQNSVLWEMNGTFVSNPVIAASTIYVVNAVNNQLEARDEATGNVLWTWQPTGGGETTPAGNLILTNNLVFISTSEKTYAIDLTTHQSVWSTAHVGALALSSNRVLYISSPSDYSVYAYSLN